jgi:hypothetical protein
MAAKTKQQASLDVDREMIDPPDCFIYFKNTAEGWAPLSGTGCAHFVAHQLRIMKGRKSHLEVCDLGYTVKVPLLVHGLGVVHPRDVKVDDIWANHARNHCGIVTSVVPAKINGGMPTIKITQCSSNRAHGRLGRNTQDWATFFSGHGVFYRP